MNTRYPIYIFFLLTSLLFSECDDYEKKIAEKEIYVNKPALSLFVGDTIQLITSPTDGTYHYTWSSEDSTVATVSPSGFVEVVGEGFTNIIVSAGDIETKVPLTAVIRVPLEDVSITETYLELVPGEKKFILVTYIPENANDIPKFSWSSEDPNVATINERGEISAVGEGVTNIIYQIGDIEKKVIVDVSYTRPFKGPHILSAAAPYELMAADFDLGGEGYAFHDRNDIDDSGQNGNYRISNGDRNSTAVDIEGFGLNIGWTDPGEWLLYTIEVEDAGKYKIDVQVAKPGTSSFHIEVDGENVTGSVGTPDTGGWGNFVWVSTPEDKLTINFTKGRHKIKYYFEDGHNFRSIKFTLTQI